MSQPFVANLKLPIRVLGNTNPRMMRSTLSFVPCSADMLKQSSLTFALSISPFARLEVDEVSKVKY